MADVFFGVDNTVLSKAIQADIFEPYQSPLLASVGTDFQLDPEFHALPVDYGDVCINYDKAFFTQKGLAVPETLDELTQPEYKNMLVVQNPATSSPGLSFLLTTIASYGDPGYLEYWKALRENGVVVAGDWETAYYNHFSGSSGQGQQPMVVSYSSSPVAEVFFSSQPLDTAPTGAITAPGTCFRQIEFAGILKGSHNTDMAKKFIDYMLDVPFQEDMPLQMFVYPVNQGAELPEIFRDHSTIAEEPAVLPADAIDQNRELWITAWEGVVLH
jgi:thiamine transport system substrate-binding protein